MNDEELLATSMAGQVQVALERLMGEDTAHRPQHATKRIEAIINAAEGDGGAVLLAAGFILQSLRETDPPCVVSPVMHNLLHSAIGTLRGVDDRVMIAVAVRVHGDDDVSTGVAVRNRKSESS